MEGKAMIEEGENIVGLPPPPSVIVAMAINGNRKSKYVVSWALEKFISQGNTVFTLLHIRPRVTAVPTPLGSSIPLSQVRDDVAAAYKKEVEWQTTQMLLPYRKLCARSKVQVDVTVIESDDIPNSIAEEVAKSSISKLVIGAPSRGIFSRKLKKQSMSRKISAVAPSFCTVYAVSKGKISSIRPSDSETNGISKDDSSDTICFTNTSSSSTAGSQTDLGSTASYSHFRSPSLQMQRLRALSSMNHNLLHSRTSSIASNHSRCQSLDIDGGSDAYNRHPFSYRSLSTDTQSCFSEQASTSDVLTEDSSSETQVNINVELEKLRIELRHVRGLYAIAQSETIDASRKLTNLNSRRIEEAVKLKETHFKEEKAYELAQQEKEKYEAVKREAEFAMECAEREAFERRGAETQTLRDTKEKEKLENALAGSMQQYQKFSWEEIMVATSSFSEHLRIGKGAYGSVYKCILHHTTAAVKVLHSKDGQESKQFQQELEILSKIRHPHLLLLLGACTEHGCLVYEYMENGSLEDRLVRKNDTIPIPWFKRYQIAWEVASALVFLHSSKPKQIIHRDLKPANILLDSNFVSKIGDVGLSTMDLSAHEDTGPVGTLCYIDPEYQRSGLISPKSDVYAFGMVILQLLTGKPAIALAHKVEMAIKNETLREILDPEAGEWPDKETKELAVLGLRCAELMQKDRPDLEDQVLGALEKLRQVADTAAYSSSGASMSPNHFICPILKEVMKDPCVAADGYTYDCKAIEKWLEENDHSPVTNLPLPNKNLIPNYTLLSAIVEWESKRW